MPTKTMRAGDLHVTPLLQSRSGGVCRDTVTEYARRMKGGEQFPPLVAYKITDRSFKKPSLVAGFHRLDAYDKAGVETFEVEVREGTFAEAWLAGWLSNDKHGLKHTNADKRKAAETALKMWREDSTRAIAERIAVSHEFINKVRKELVATGQLEDTEKVKGKDGVPQPARKRQSDAGTSPVSTVDTCDDETGEIPEETASLPFGDSEPEPVEPDAEEEPAAPPAPKNSPATVSGPVLKDGLGNVVPRGLADTFADPMLTDAIARIDAVHREIISIEQHVLKTLSKKGAFWPYAQYGECAKSLGTAADRVAEASAQLANGVPFCVCPKCKGDGCKTCRQSGAWPRHRHDNRDQYGDAA